MDLAPCSDKPTEYLFLCDSMLHSVTVMRLAISKFLNRCNGVNMHETAINRVLPQPTVSALAGFSSEIPQDTTSCARLSAPIYLSMGGKESITAVEIFPCRRSVSTHDKAPEALIFPSLTHSIHLSWSPPCISTSSHPSHRSSSYASSRACN